MNKTTRKPSKTWIIGLVIVVVAAVFALPRLVLAKEPSGNEIAAKTGDITTYYSFSGSIQAQNRQMMYAEQASQISALKVKEGDIVKNNDVLYVTKTGVSVKARTAGEIAKIYAQENEQLMPGAKILEIVDYSNLQLQVQVDENDLAAIRKDERAAVTINALGKDVEGTVTDVSKEGTYSNGVTFFTAAITLPQDDSIRVGMSAEAKIAKAKATGVVMLPMSAVQFDGNNQAYVYVQGNKGKLNTIPLNLGITDGANVEVKSGLTAVDKVFVPQAPKTAPTPGRGLGMNGGGR